MTTNSAVQKKEAVVENTYDTVQIRQIPKSDEQDTFVSYRTRPGTGLRDDPPLPSRTGNLGAMMLYDINAIIVQHDIIIDEIGGRA